MQRLAHGQFFGTGEARCSAAGFALTIAAADPRRPVARHTHEDAHFILLLDGHYLSAAKGAGHLHAEPALIYNPPGTTHEDTFPECSGRFLGVSISAPRFAEVEQLAPTTERAIRIWDPAALGAAHRVAHRVAHADSAFALEAECLELVAALVRDRPERRPPGWLVRARELLHDRACERLDMTMIAAECGVHPVYLARQFRRFFGCTPAEYQRACRIEHAAVRLRAGDEPLAAIAVGCGFVDQAHFTRSFARTFATSPGAYRRRYRA
jgi:AraC family transcriptional regulator